jgi:hypothetical protein
MKTAKDFLFSKYPNVSPEWFDDNELTQEMLMMMEEYASQYRQIIAKQEELIDHISRAFEFQADDKLIDFHYEWAKILSDLVKLKGETPAKDELNK